MTTAELKIGAALSCIQDCTPGDWWVDSRGEMHNDPVGLSKLAKFVDGHDVASRSANRMVLAASKELALEVVRLRALLTETLATWEVERIDRTKTLGPRFEQIRQEARDERRALYDGDNVSLKFADYCVELVGEVLILRHELAKSQEEAVRLRYELVVCQADLITARQCINNLRPFGE